MYKLTILLAVASCGTPTRIEQQTEAVYNSSCPTQPQIWIDTSTPPTPTGTVWTPTTSAELTTALANVAPGDEIVLGASNIYTGPFTLKAQPAGSAWIWIHTDQVGQPGFPATGVRAERSQSTALTNLISPNGSHALVTADGANHYWITGVEFRASTSATSLDSLVELGNRTSTTSKADNIVLDRCYIHGRDDVTIKRGVMMNGSYLSVVQSRVGEIHTLAPVSCSGASEAQGIMSFNGPGPYKISDNYISGSTQGIMFGGADAANSSMVPGDIEISFNHMYKPIAWKTRTPTAFLAKTGFELKDATRVKVIGNYIENSWDNCGTENKPYAIRITPRNQGGTSGGSFHNVTHVTFVNNKLINHPRGGLILGSDDSAPSGQMDCVDISNNLWDKIPGDFSADINADGRMLTVVSGGVSTTIGGAKDLTIQHNTMVGNAEAVFADFGGGGRTDKNPATIYQNNILIGGSSKRGIWGTGQAEGNNTLSTYFTTDLTFARNDIVGSTQTKYSSYVSTNSADFNYGFFSTSGSTVGFTDWTNHNYVLTTSSPDHNQCTHKFLVPPLPQDIGVYDWSSATGIGAADDARDSELD
jgi:hypothetical protein